jgi:hypothetical protein
MKLCSINYVLALSWSVKLINPTKQSPLDKRNGPSTCQEYTAFHETSVFITIFKRSHNWNLFWARLIQYTPSHSKYSRKAYVFQAISFLQILRSTLCMYFSSSPCVLHRPPTSFSMIWSSSYYLSFDVITAMRTKINVFRDVMQGTSVGRLLRNVATKLHDVTFQKILIS